MLNEGVRWKVWFAIFDRYCYCGKFIKYDCSLLSVTAVAIVELKELLMGTTRGTCLCLVYHDNLY